MKTPESPPPIAVHLIPFAIALGVLFGSTALCQEPRSARPNVVVLFADDLDADEINVTSGMTDVWATPSGAKKHLGKSAKPSDPKVYTPNIDSLASQGMLFTRFYVNGTVCSSSRYCLLTGRYAFQGESLLRRTPAGSHHTLEWEPDILRSEDSLPKQLQNRGYRTGIIGKWHNMPKEILPKRNKKAHVANATYADTKQYEDSIKAYYRAGLEYLSDGFGWDVVDRMEFGNSIVNLDWQCEGALKFIEESAGSADSGQEAQPFFLYCSLPVPHGQYSFGYNDVSSYDNRVTANGLLDGPLHLLPTSEDVLRRVKANGVSKQNAMATRMDDYVGAVLNKLKEHGLSDNTIVLFTSDHGSRGKNSCYEGGAKVPLIASWPAKVKPGSRCDSLIGSIDLTSTLIELASGDSSLASAPHSRSFVPQLMGHPDSDDWREGMLIEAGNSKAIVTKNWKYIANRVPPEIEKAMKARPGEVFWTGLDHHNYQTEKMYPAYWDADQLYNLNDDLYEQTNLASSADNSALLEKLKEDLRNRLSTMQHTFGDF